MIIFQFQFVDIESEKEQEIMEDFCKWLCEEIYSRINTKVNRRKIQLRIKYLFTVPWITWKGTPYIDVETIMRSIKESLTYKQYRKNVWRIVTNTNKVIPNTVTSMDRLIRFLNYGDKNAGATGILTLLQKYFDYNQLQSSWRLYCLDKLGYLTDTKIVGEAKRK